VLDVQNRPHISYSDYGVLKYAYWSGSEWQIWIVDGSGWAENYISLALDRAGAPHISDFYVYGGGASLR
jgi:hypothetical protein